MKNFLIHVLDENTFESYGLECCTGEIAIGDYKETFEMPLEYWTIDDYKKQWKDGIERLKTYNRTCLVAEVQDPLRAPRAVLWVLYREGNKVYLRNNLLFGERFEKMLKKQPFNLETCYNFTLPRSLSTDKEYPISEWTLELKDFFDQIIR